MSNQDKPLPVSSSIPPDFPPKQRRLFREVLELLQNRGIPFAVSGAFALHQHTGIWRDTKDLDLFTPTENATLALRFLQEDGFEVEVPDPVWLAKAHRHGYYVDLISGMSNAAVVVDAIWIERAVPAEILGVAVPVLAAEELIASKLFVSRRERFDGADLAHIFYRAGPRLDWDRLLALAGEHWEVLFWALVLFHYAYPAAVGQVPREIWDGLLCRFRRALDDPAPNARFRGSLIDDKIFAIDVNEWGLSDLAAECRQRKPTRILPPDKAA
jgi:predicted nucleotidyltransferase